MKILKYSAIGLLSVIAMLIAFCLGWLWGGSQQYHNRYESEYSFLNKNVDLHSGVFPKLKISFTSRGILRFEGECTPEEYDSLKKLVLELFGKKDSEYRFNISKTKSTPQ